MLGFVMAGVSPAVIIPSLIPLIKEGYGTDRGIHTLVITACSADDVVAISGFGIFLGINFVKVSIFVILGVMMGTHFVKDSDLFNLILHGPIEVLIGLSFGTGWGLLAQYIPHRQHNHRIFFRSLILFSGGLVALFGAHLVHYDGAGGLATVTMAFVAGIQWRREGWGDHNPVFEIFTKIWLLFEPILFALIGTEIRVSKCH